MAPAGQASAQAPQETQAEVILYAMGSTSIRFVSSLYHTILKMQVYRAKKITVKLGKATKNPVHKLFSKRSKKVKKQILTFKASVIY